MGKEIRCGLWRKGNMRKGRRTNPISLLTGGDNPSMGRGYE